MIAMENYVWGEIPENEPPIIVPKKPKKPEPIVITKVIEKPAP